jgi:hypothetical protein
VVWFLGGNPYGFPRTMTLQRELYKLVHPAKTDAEGDMAFLLAQNAEAARDKMLPEVRPLYVDWIRQMATHARANGWPEVIVTPFDEPAKWVQQPGRTDGKPAPGVIGTGPWIKTYFEDSCAAIKEGDAKTRIYASIHNNRTEKNEGFIFLPVVDVFCCGSAYFNAPWMMAKVKATPGKEFWQYGGGEATAPNSGRYFFGFFLSWQEARGTLCWAYNRTSGFDAFWANNWAYAWMTPFDVIPSPLFQAMRAGGDIRRIVETYKKKFANDPEAMAMLTKTLDEAHELGTTKSSEHVNLQGGSFWLRPDNGAQMDQLRDRLLDKLAGSQH